MTLLRPQTLFPLILTLAVVFGCATGLSPQEKKQAESARNLGEAYIMEKRFSAALGELLKAEKINPDDPIIHNNLGLVYREKGKFDLAVTHFEKAVALKPSYSVACNNLGSAYLLIEEWDKAIVILEKVSQDLLYGTPQYPLANLGWAYYKKRDYAKARDYLTEALKLAPDFFTAKLNLARTALATGRLQEARKLLEEAAPTSPNNPVLLLELGRTYRLLGNYRNARLALKGAIKFSKNTQLSQEATRELKKLR